jgi:Leucine-rich repeat (LRR) protein
LQTLGLPGNNISDISALASLTNLEWLDLMSNNISDISPLVENSGLSAGNTVYLSGNPLSTTSVNAYIPQLEARGVYIMY